MIPLTRPEVILTHESDLDGLLSGLLLQRLARRVFDEHVPLQAYHNHSWRQRRMEEKTAWVSDLALDKRVDQHGWLVVDHHMTEIIPRHATLVHDIHKSAALLCYELCRDHGLVTEKLDRLVHLNNVADLFLEDHPDFVIACDYANLVKTYGFRNLEALIEGDPERLMNHALLEVMEVKRRVEDPIGLKYCRQNVSEVTPTIGLVNVLVGNTNQIVHQLLEQKATPYEVLISLYRRGNGMILVSLRSRNGGALAVAEKLQGGGHANASGATLPRSVQNIPDAIVYLRQVLNSASAQSQPLNRLESLFAPLEAGTK